MSPPGPASRRSFGKAVLIGFIVISVIAGAIDWFGVARILIMNVMIRQHRSEIGLLKALDASDRQVLGPFLGQDAPFPAGHALIS